MDREKTVRPFGWRDKVGYMFGDFGNDFTFLFASTFLMIFYTKVLGISMGLVGTLFLTARCIDAFTDVTMGRIVDRMHTEKRRKIPSMAASDVRSGRNFKFSDVPVLVSGCIHDGQSHLYVCHLYLVG